MTESAVQRAVQLAAPEARTRLLRNNIGAFKDEAGQWVHYGVGGKGGSDTIGWRSIEITPDMVGATVAVFVAAEIKSEEWRPPKSGERLKHWEQQQAFIAAVVKAGGIGFVAQSVPVALKALHGFKPGRP